MDTVTSKACVNIPMKENGAHRVKKKKKKKKPSNEDRIEVCLAELVVDSSLREATGLKKKRSTAYPQLTKDTHVEHESSPLHKGLRKEKKPTTAKKQIMRTRILGNPQLQHTVGNIFLTSLDEKVINLLEKLKKQIDAIHKTNPVKARSKRSFVCGLHESLKHIRAGNVKCVIIARNIDAEVIAGPSLFHALRAECLARGIPMVHASTKRLLSRAVRKHPYTNIIALFDLQDFKEVYDSIMQEWTLNKSHIQYHTDQTSLFA